MEKTKDVGIYLNGTMPASMPKAQGSLFNSTRMHAQDCLLELDVVMQDGAGVTVNSWTTCGTMA